VTLIEEKKTKGPRGRRFGADPGRSLGEHPDKGGPVVVKNGRYGPYVSHDGINATLPSDKTPETITLAEAIPLLDARAARGGGKKSSARRRSAPAKGAGRKAAPEKAARASTQPAAAAAKAKTVRKAKSAKAPAKSSAK
jgi:DNA topoisomerase-1